MNIRLKKYKANRILGMNQYNAAIAAGFSVSYARDHSHKIEKSVKVGILDALEQAGLTDKIQATELAKLAVAVKNQSCDIYVQKDKDGKWVINENKNEFITVEDHNIRLATWKHIAELKKQKVGAGINITTNVKVENGKLNGDHKRKQEEMRRFLRSELQI